MTTKTMEPLLNTVLECQKTCNNCFYACLKEDDVKMMAECIRLDRECADLCGLVVDFAQRESDRLPEILELCANACDACADECEKHDMDHCQACAKACRECATACREYAKKI